MTPAAPPTSNRLRRAAVAERAELGRHRSRLLAQRESLRAELARIEAGLADLDDRQSLLERLAPTPDAEHEDISGASRQIAEEAPPTDARVLRGPAIREAAVRALATSPDIEALHYRAWFAMVTDSGVTIAGKDPLAVFLTQLNRSPLIRRSTQSGVYELDRTAPARLRARLEELQIQLRDLTAKTANTADLGAIRERRKSLNADISQVEKALEEASRLLVDSGEPRLAAAV